MTLKRISLLWYICGAVAGVFVLGVLHVRMSGVDGAQAIAADALSACTHPREGKEACYERVVPALYPSHSLEVLFDAIRMIRAHDAGYQFCHVLGHKLGEAAVAEDPEHWIDLMSKNPRDGLCSNGFIHGVIGGRFRAEVLDDATLERFIPDFSRACEPRQNWKATSLDQAMCYHGMGHLYMFITDAYIGKALSLCERTSADKGTGDFRRVCVEGVYMQIYQPLEPDDFLMLERMPEVPTAATVRSFCSRYGYGNASYEGACLRESWPLFKQDILSGAGVEQFCSGQPDEAETQHCFESAFSIIGRMSIGNPSQALSACAQLPYTRKPDCYAYSSRTIMEEEREDIGRAVSFCDAVPRRYKPGCFVALMSTADFMLGNDESSKHALCAAIENKTGASCASVQTQGVPYYGALHTK